MQANGKQILDELYYFTRTWCFTIHRQRMKMLGRWNFQWPSRRNWCFQLYSIREAIKSFPYHNYTNCNHYWLMCRKYMNEWINLLCLLYIKCNIKYVIRRQELGKTSKCLESYMLLLLIPRIFMKIKWLFMVKYILSIFKQILTKWTCRSMTWCLLND